MDDAEAPVFYDDDVDFIKHEYLQYGEYDFDYEDTERETLLELYQYCLGPTVYDTFSYILPLFITTILFRLCARSPYYKSLGIFLPSLFIIAYCEFSMPPIIWHKVRSVVMTMAMKTISVAIDKIDTNDLPDIYTYMGYTFCSVTCLFGPWMSFKDYISIRYTSNQDKWWILYAVQYALISFLFLTISNCWMQWMIMDNSWKWLLAYRDALSFRMSHYFISYIASTLLLLGGFPFPLTYLGLMFDTSELQETGYSYIHTIEKWSQLGFASHWVVFATYCIYFLIR
ncbi:Protein-serine O-palmitoleoyltransferase porcupine [Anthophora retusa]